MTQIQPVACDSCIHRITATSCEAFDLIPTRISTWGDPHNSPVKGQGNSITWDFAPGTQQEFDLWKSVMETSV